MRRRLRAPSLCGLAFWWAEPEVTSAAPETSAYSVLPAAAQPGPTTEARVTVASSAPARGALAELPTEFSCIASLQIGREKQ